MPATSLIVVWGLGWMAVAASMGAQQSPPPPATQLLDMYARGEADAGAALLDSIPDDKLEDLAKEIRRATPAWLAAKDAQALPRRRLAAATLALDLFHAGYQTEWKVLRDMVEWGCGLVQKNPPGEAERLWFLASVAALGGARDRLMLTGDVEGGPLKASHHVRHARERFPDDARWQLADAVAREFPLMSEGVRDAPGMTHGEVRMTPLGEDRVRLERARAQAEQRARQLLIAEFEALTSVLAIAPEAHLHAGYQLFIARRFGDALDHYKQAARLSDDPYVRYLAFFFAGRLLGVQQQPADAETSYRLALEAMPNVQSGAEALATALFLRGRRDEAYALVGAAFAASPRPSDPWRLYVFGDYRWWPALVRRLHAELK